MCEPLIRQFYSNAVIREDELSCWVKGTEFTLDAQDIDDILGLEGLEDHDFINYKDRMLLGYKDLGFYVFRILICIVGKP